MSEILARFSVDAMKMNAQVIACMVLIWLGVLFCVLASINTQPFGRRQRLFWLVFVTAAPMVGALCYLPFSFRIESYPSLSMLKRSR